MKWSSQQRFRNKRRKSFPGWLMHVWSIYGLSGVSSRDLPFFITERKAKWRKNIAPLISLYCFVINCNTLLVSHLWVFAVFDGFENWFSQCSNSLRLPLTLTWETSSKAVHRDQFISDERPHLWLAKKLLWRRLNVTNTQRSVINPPTSALNILRGAEWTWTSEINLFQSSAVSITHEFNVVFVCTVEA